MQLVELIDGLQPPFFTLEEVPGFLVSNVGRGKGGAGASSIRVRPVWGLVLPLLDRGYQVRFWDAPSRCRVCN